VVDQGGWEGTGEGRGKERLDEEDGHGAASRCSDADIAGWSLGSRGDVDWERGERLVEHVNEDEKRPSGIDEFLVPSPLLTRSTVPQGREAGEEEAAQGPC
jgi:hypothetical protein